MNNKAISVGNACYDITLQVPKFPEEDTKVRVGESIECPGGVAANCASLLAKWGMESYFVGAVGNDIYGEKIKKKLLLDNVHLDYLQTSNEFSTTVGYILASHENGSRTIISSRTKTKEAMFHQVPTHATVIIADGEEPELTIETIKNNETAISILDAGNLKDNIVKLCPYVDYIITSRDFAEEYTKLSVDPEDTDSLIKAYDKMANDFNSIIVITLGKYGCFTKMNNYMLIPSFKMDAIDSTGAGDIFHGAFAFFISHNYDLCDTIKLANITGALSTLKIGGNYSIPELEEVYDKAKEYALNK